jgi:metal-sulfur cluster biosynthetic enzyme
MMLDNEFILQVLKSVIDPELGINIVDLGLIYGIDIYEDGRVKISMTLTTPGCPMHNTIETGVKYALEQETGRNDHIVEFVWDPAWTPEMMSPEAKEALWG